MITVLNGLASFKESAETTLMHMQRRWAILNADSDLGRLLAIQLPATRDRLLLLGRDKRSLVGLYEALEVARIDASVVAGNPRAARYGRKLTAAARTLEGVDCAVVVGRPPVAGNRLTDSTEHDWHRAIGESVTDVLAILRVLQQFLAESQQGSVVYVFRMATTTVKPTRIDTVAAGMARALLRELSEKWGHTGVAVHSLTLDLPSTEAGRSLGYLAPQAGNLVERIRLLASTRAGPASGQQRNDPPWLSDFEDKDDGFGIPGY